MNKDTTEDNRKGSRGKVSNDRLDVIAAKRDQLEGEIQHAYIMIKDAAEKQESMRAAERGLQRRVLHKVLH